MPARVCLSLCLSLCTALVLSSSGALPSWAEEIASEPFEYDPGELDGEDGGEGWAGAWLADAPVTEIIETDDDPLEYTVPDGGLVSDNGRALEFIPISDNAIAREFAEPLSVDDVYISFLIRFHGEFHDNDFMGIWFDDFASGTHGPVPGIGLKTNQGGGGTLDIFSRLALNGEVYSTEIEADETYFVVGHMYKDPPGEQEAYSTFDLWVNPSADSEDTPDATAFGFAASSYTMLGVRVPNIADDDRVLIASLRLGTEWEDVVPLDDQPPGGTRFVRGDVDGNGAEEITDAVNNLSFQFTGSFAPTCMDALDYDDNGAIELTDPIGSLTGQFLGGPPASPPTGTCGIDPTEDSLSCDSFPSCAE